MTVEDRRERGRSVIDASIAAASDGVIAGLFPARSRRVREPGGAERRTRS